MGNSMYFGSVTPTVNYCSINTSIYSATQTINPDYDWWADSDMENLIENLPSSVKINSFAKLKITTDASNLKWN